MSKQQSQAAAQAAQTGGVSTPAADAPDTQNGQSGAQGSETASTDASGAEGDKSSDEAPAPQPKNRRERSRQPEAATSVQTLKRRGGKVVALSNIKRKAGFVRAGQEFSPVDDAELAELVAAGCIKG